MFSKTMKILFSCLCLWIVGDEMNVDMWKSNAENSLRATELNMTNNDKGSGAQQLVIERNRQRMCARK